LQKAMEKQRVSYADLNEETSTPMDEINDQQTITHTHIHTHVLTHKQNTKTTYTHKRIYTYMHTHMHQRTYKYKKRKCLPHQAKPYDGKKADK
jgi:hypothetical protein